MDRSQHPPGGTGTFARCALTVLIETGTLNVLTWDSGPDSRAASSPALVMTRI
jgi:hypothetical protein